MYNRRKFLQTSGALALGGILLPKLSKAAIFEFPDVTKQIGIQVYSVNKFLGKDPKALFEQLAKIGFVNIETAFNPVGPYYGYTPKELSAMIRGMGMKWLSHHVAGAGFNRPPAGNANPKPQGNTQSFPKFLNLRDDLQQLVNDAAEGGLEFLTCASTPIGTLAEVNKSIDTFQKAGEACKKAGIQFVYHNHATEFDPVEGGKSAYELILSQTDKDLVKMELDLAWAAKAKQNPSELFKENPGRFPLWHIKDYDLANNKIMPIGKGSVDFKPTFEHARLAGLRYYFYEQDGVQNMEDVELSYTNLKNLVS